MKIVPSDGRTAMPFGCAFSVTFAGHALLPGVLQPFNPATRLQIAMRLTA
jgi:hypothetical protein